VQQELARSLAVLVHAYEPTTCLAALLAWDLLLALVAVKTIKWGRSSGRTPPVTSQPFSSQLSLD